MEPFPSHDAPGFDRPLDLLHACHTRIEQRCDWLERLVDHVAEHGSHGFLLLWRAVAPRG